MDKKVVLKIGGSILYNNNLDVNFDILRKLKTWYDGAKSSMEKVVIVTGGGGLSRDLQKKIAGSIGGEEYLHNIAMSVTQTNAAMLQGFLEDSEIYIPKRLGDAYEFLNEEKNKTLISGGLKIGWSTDMDAAAYADMLDINIVYKISNIDYVYDSDPHDNPQAKAYKDMTWKEYFQLFNIAEGDGHEANKNIPIDVMCAQFCQKKGIAFFVCGGDSLQNKQRIEDILMNGTLIH